MVDKERPLYEGDNVLLYSSEKDGFLYAEPSSACTGSLTLKPVTNPQDPQFPILAFAVFKVIPENECMSIKKPQDSSKTTVVFGRRVRLFNAASQQFMSISSSSINAEKNDATVFVIRSPLSTEFRGKDVLCQRSIRLESNCKRGCFLSTAYDLATDSHQIILKGLGLKFIVYLHSRQCEDDEKYLLAGRPVMLHSLKRDGELSARSCFLMSTIDKSDRVVECRRRVKVHGVDKAPPESGDTFWQLELISEPYSGAPLQWNDKCRIKHLPSHLYAAVVPISGAEDRYKVILQEPSENSDMRDECFILTHPDSQSESGSFIHAGSHLLLIHDKTQRRIIVSATTREIQAKHVFYSTNRRLNVSTTLNQAPIDMSIFRIDQVQCESMVEFYYATSWATAMNESVSWLKVAGSVKPGEYETITGGLSSLVHWLQEASNPSRRADMLRTLTVVELFYSMLESCSVSLDDGKCLLPGEKLMLRSILKSVTSTMKKYIQVAKQKSRRYLIQEDYLQALFGKPSSRVCIQEVLTVLAKSDSMSADKIAEHIFEHDISGMLQGMDSIHFLMALSTASNKYARQIQNVLFLTIENAPQDTHVEKRLDTVVRYMMTIVDFSVPTIDKLWKTFEYNRLTAFDPWKGASVRSPYTMVQKPDVIKELQRTIREHLKENASISPAKEATEKNSVTIQLLRIFESLVKYGFYSSEDQLRILPYLVNMIDGKTDNNLQHEHPMMSWKMLSVATRSQSASYTSETKSRYTDVKKNRQVVKIKTIGVRILQGFFTMLSYVTLERFLHDFKTSLEKTGTFVRKQSQISLPGVQIHATSAAAAMNSLHQQKSLSFIPQHLFKSQSEEDLVDADEAEQFFYYTPLPLSLSHVMNQPSLQSCDITERDVLEARARISHLFDDGSYSVFNTSCIEGDQLVQVLMGLLDYEDSELCLSTAQLLFDMYSKGKLLMNSVREVHLVTSHMKSFLKKVLKIASLSEENPELLETIDELCDECVAKNDENEPAVCQQAILYSSGLFLLVLEYVLKYGHSDDRLYERPKLKCYELLRRISRKNPKAQIKLFHSLNDLLKERLCVFSMAELLTEVFSNNEELCRIGCTWDPGLKQFLTEAISSDNPEHNELLHTMEVMLKSCPGIKVDVTRSIQEASLSDLSHILSSSDIVKKRRTMLLLNKSYEVVSQRGEDHCDDYYDLYLLLNITDLLATCCQGELLQTEQVASKLFPLDEIIGILSHPNIPLENKKPFISLLTWAFVETERDSLVCLTHLARSKGFIAHLEEVVFILKAMADNLHEVDISRIQKNLRTLNCRCLSVLGWMRLCQFDPAVFVTISGCTASLKGLLLYLLHGLAPLLTIICSKLNTHQQRNKESRRSSSDLYNSMFSDSLYDFGVTLTMFQRRWSIFKEPEHTEILSTCLYSIDSMLKNSSLTKKDSQFILDKRIGIPITVQTAHKTEIEEIASEKALNKMLAIFITNYSKICGSYTKEEMEYKEPDSKFVEFVYGSPHGTCLQRLVDLFDDNDSENFSNLQKLLRLLDITYNKLHRQTNGLERVQLDRVLYITLQIIYCLLQRRVTLVEMAKEHKRRRAYERHLKPMQDQLLELKAHEKIMKHVSHPCEEIIIKVIAIMKQLLFYGNSSAQVLIGSQISSDQAELLFPKFRKMLEAADLALATYHSALASIPVNLATDNPVSPLVSPQACSHNRGNQSVQFFAQESYSQPEDLAIELMNLSQQDHAQTVTTEFTHVIEQISIDVEDDSVTSSSSPEPTQQITRGRRGVLKRNDLKQTRCTLTPNEITEELISHNNEIHMNTLGDKEANAVLDVVSFLCDGQRKDLQDMFGKETTHFAGSSMIIQITFLLESVAETITIQNLQIAGRAIQALIELCAGNFTNQEVAFRGQALASINTFLKLDPMSFEKEMWLEIMCVKCSAVELLEVMLEETDPSSCVLARKIFTQLVLNDLLLTMKQLWEALSAPSAADGKKHKGKWRNGLLKSYHTLKMIAHYRGIRPEPSIKHYFQQKYGKLDRAVDKMLCFCEEWSHSIEIEYKPKGILTRVHFPFPPETHLSGSDKDTIKNKIKRDSEDEKLRDLLRWTEGIRKHQRWTRQLKKRIWLKWVTEFSFIRNSLLILLTLVLNVLLFVGIRNDGMRINNSTISIIVTPHSLPQWYWPHTLYPLGSIHLVLSLWMVVDFYVREFPHFHLDSPLLHTLMWRLSQREPKVLKIFARILNRPIKITKPQPYGHFNRTTGDFWGCYRVLFLICSCVSLGTDGTFYPVCLVYTFINTEFLGTILTSVTKSALSLTIIFLLGLVILMGYAVVAFSVFNNFFHAPSEGLFCDTLFACFVTVVRLGALANPPLGDNIRIDGQYIALSLFRLAYGLSYFIVVTTLGLNVVIAILVDNFSALRQTKNEVEQDKQSVCFICGLTKSDLDYRAKMHGGFINHVQRDHCMWNYIYFAIYLDYLDENDHNALEKYIFDQMIKKEIDFFPRGQAKLISDAEAHSVMIQ